MSFRIYILWSLFLTLSISTFNLKGGNSMPYDTLEIYSDYKSPSYYNLGVDDIVSFEEIMSRWVTEGEVPTHIVYEPYRQSMAHKVCRRLADIVQLKMSVTVSDSEMLDVEWREIPNLITSGSFSFPMLSRYSSEGYTFTPYKAGYSFSPDITSFGGDNLNKERLFTALPLKLTDELLTSLVTDRLCSSYNYRNIDIVSTDRGRAFSFNGDDSFVDCGNSLEYNFDREMTVSTWIKPHSIDGYRSILGKGSSFSLKLFNGAPTFTIVRYADYSAEGSELPIDAWSHVAISFLPGRRISIYINGELIEEFRCDRRVISNSNSVIIGSNISSETLDGEMADLRVWSRELSGDEVKSLYLERADGVTLLDKIFYIEWYWIFVAIALSLSIIKIVLVGVKRGRVSDISEDDIDSNGTVDDIDSTGCDGLTSDIELEREEVIDDNTILQINRVSTFGRFRVWNSRGEEISSKFSPQIKSLFTLFITHSTPEIAGITTERLTEYIWNSDNPQRVKGARAASIRKLREIIKDIDGVDLIYSDKRWQIELADAKQCDYIYFHRLLQRDTISYREAVKLLQRGALSLNVSDEWFDQVHSKFVDSVLLFCRLGIDANRSDNSYLLCGELSDIMFIYDPISEYALQIKIWSLRGEGQHTLAKRLYDRFCRDYKKLYGEEYSLSYLELFTDATPDNIPNNSL